MGYKLKCSKCAAVALVMAISLTPVSVSAGDSIPYSVAIRPIQSVSSGYVIDSDSLESEPILIDEHETSSEGYFNRVIQNMQAIVGEPNNPLPKESVSSSVNGTALIDQRTMIFGNSDLFWMRRYNFTENDMSKQYMSAFTIPGNDITIKYIDINGTSKKWVETKELTNLPNAVLFINTDKYSMVLGPKAVYKNSFLNNTIESCPEFETPVEIVRENGQFKFTIKFPNDTGYVGEIWALQSENALVDWDNEIIKETLLVHDLQKERRFSWDGYYFRSYSSYEPYTPNTFFRHPSNYTGIGLATLNGSNFDRELGYVMVKTQLANQNEEGYWTTGSRSQWLDKDFQIGAGFYDTRFNTDFVIGLINIYPKFKDVSMLKAALKYADFYMGYAANNSYPTANGILVQDYGYNLPHRGTHVSLNHHLAEANLMYKLYLLTGEQQYMDLADKMIMGIEDTQALWVKSDGNLEYSLHYSGYRDDMADYPYLTYNDLFETQLLYSSVHNVENLAIKALMDSKRKWMDDNKITGYRVE